MKRYSITLLSVLICSSLILSGCNTGNKPSDKETKDTEETTEQTTTETTIEETEETTTETSQEVEEPEETEPEEPEFSILELDPAYEQIVYDMTSFISEFCEDTEIPEGYEWISDEIMYETKTSITQNHGYALYDLNSDGTEELFIIKENSSFGDNVYYTIDALYTISNGEVVQLISGWSRNLFILDDDGSIFNSASSGAFSSTYGNFVYDESLTDKTWENFYFTAVTDDNDVLTYTNSTGSTDVTESEVVDDNDLWEIMQNYIDNAFIFERITRLSEFAAEKNIEFKPEAASTNIWELRKEFIDEDSILVYAPEVTEDTEFATYVQIATNAEIRNVSLLYFKNQEIDDDGNITFDTEVVETIDSIDRNSSLIYVVSFHEYLPTVGFQYEDNDGTVKKFIIYTSGEDGSLYLSPIDS